MALLDVEFDSRDTQRWLGQHLTNNRSDLRSAEDDRSEDAALHGRATFLVGVA